MKYATAATKTEVLADKPVGLYRLTGTDLAVETLYDVRTDDFVAGPSVEYARVLEPDSDLERIGIPSALKAGAITMETRADGCYVVFQRIVDNVSFEPDKREQVA